MPLGNYSVKSLQHSFDLSCSHLIAHFATNIGLIITNHQWHHRNLDYTALQRTMIIYCLKFLSAQSNKGLLILLLRWNETLTRLKVFWLGPSSLIPQSRFPDHSAELDRLSWAELLAHPSQDCWQRDSKQLSSALEAGVTPLHHQLEFRWNFFVFAQVSWKVGFHAAIDNDATVISIVLFYRQIW